MFGPRSFARWLPAVDAVLADGERRRAASVLRGTGLDPDASRSADWLLVATDRRVLLFSLPAGWGGMPILVRSFPRGEVLVLDAQLSGTASTLVVRFPDAVLGWFHPPSAWREETAGLVAELGRVVPYPDDERRQRDDRRSSEGS